MCACVFVESEIGKREEKREGRWERKEQEKKNDSERVRDMCDHSHT